ncbi:MAG: LarC family nickel insertion protein [Candidatus Nanopelagicales bacterium]|nr:LarC family nickel insertion protein [Candidatus Nanopelagicales bacterium]
MDTAHGRLTVPGPAVTRLLEGVPTFAGPTPHEACTPTGAALLRTLADEYGPQPPMVVQRSGVGAGGRDTAGVPNVVRILAGTASQQVVDVVMVETTIDDLDPRVYPDVLVAVKAAGALEAWLTPVIMKQGRPGVTLSAVVAHAAAPAVSDAIFRHTTTLGVRQTPGQRRDLPAHHDARGPADAGAPGGPGPRSHRRGRGRAAGLGQTRPAWRTGGQRPAGTA